MTRPIFVVASNNYLLHIAYASDYDLRHEIRDTKHKTICGKTKYLILEKVELDGLYRKPANSHTYGGTLVRHATCEKCLKGLPSRDKTVLAPFASPRPLPKQKTLKGVNKLMSNVRERCRRQSMHALYENKIWLSRRTNAWQKSSALRIWDEGHHSAFMMGVNYAISEVFQTFKLEEYDKFREAAYLEMRDILSND